MAALLSSVKTVQKYLGTTFTLESGAEVFELRDLRA